MDASMGSASQGIVIEGVGGTGQPNVIGGWEDLRDFEDFLGGNACIL
jgi:hypothetical protein